MSKANTSAVSIDSGSSYMKAYSGGEPITFPGVVRRVFPGEDPPGALEALGKRWLVGDVVLRERADPYEPDRSRWFHGGEAQYVQICHALARLGIKGNAKLKRLTLSLPYERASEDAFRSRLGAWDSFAWRDANGEHVVEFPKPIRVMPQGVGALLHHQAQAGATPFDAALMVDVGSCTTDIVVVRVRDGDWDFMRDACFSDQSVSATEFFHIWRREVGRISGFANKQFSYYELMQRLMGDGPPTITYRGEEISLEASAHRARMEFTRRLKGVVMEYAAPYWDELEQILLTGGGANCVDLDVWGDKRTHVLGTLANVLGQHQE